jgi:hypothetical protein
LASVEIPFLAQVVCAGPAFSIDRPLKIYRIHGGSAYQVEARKAARPGNLFAHYLNIWGCLWSAISRSGLSLPTYFGLITYLLGSFPLYLARMAKQEFVALFRRDGPAGG